MNTNTKTIIGAVIGLVVGLVVGWLVADRTPAELQFEETADTEEEIVTATPDDRVPLPFVDTEVVEVKDQAAAGQVFISRVALVAPGWVAIQEDGAGEPGTILGARRFDAGTHQGTVTLLRGTVAGERYVATLWRDDGDGAFDHTVDVRITPPVQMSFEAY